jgi:hypothetical protein
MSEGIKMKGYIISWVIAFILIMSGVGVILSDWGGQTNYYASGKVLLDKEQWEQFKSVIITEPSMSLDKLQALNGDTKTDGNYNVRVLDWGNSKVVELNHVKVSKDFKYGNVTSEFNKEGSGFTYFFEGFLIWAGVLDAIATLIVMMIKIMTD